MADHIRTHGLRGASAPAVPARVRVEAYHINYALERRPRVGWQNLAQQLRVNAEDLKAACEAKAAKVTLPMTAGLGLVARHSQEHDTLAAINQGYGRMAELAKALEVDFAEVRTLCDALVAKRLIEREAHALPYALTAEGRAELTRLGAR